MPISTLQLTGGGVLSFRWRDEEQGNITLVFRNRLNHEQVGKISFPRRVFESVSRRGLNLNYYGIPYDIPLEVVLQGTRNGKPFEDYPDCSRLGKPIRLTCTVEVRERRTGRFSRETMELYAVDVPYIPGVETLREGIIYLVLSPCERRNQGEVKIFLPELEVGKRNYFVWQEPPGYDLLKEHPYRNEAIPEYDMFHVVYEEPRNTGGARYVLF